MRILASGLGAAALGLAALVPVAGTAAAAPSATGELHAHRVCAAPTEAGMASCLAEVLVHKGSKPPSNSGPPASAMTPSDLISAYNLAGTSGAGRTVAIVDAYGYPTLESDLAVYRSQFNLPPCTTANGCLTILDQNGGTNYPRFDSGWAGEQALDVDAVSAICPDCHILVVQADSASFANLGTAVQTAAAQPGVVAISNSYGGGDAPDSTYGVYYNHPGIAVTASTGDNGYQGGSYPASSSYVTAVGGTSLYKAGGARGWTETAWSGAGSGCSSYNAPVAPQSLTGCANRAMADVSAAADPSNGGMAVYWPSGRRGSTWAQVGGTSESSPIIAAVYALAGGGYSNATPYANPGALYDVTSGSNGTCPVAQWCVAGTGWDGPTGLGTPNGTGAF